MTRTTRHCFSHLAALIVALVTIATPLFAIDSADAQCFAPRSSSEIELALEKLKVTGSVLYVAAHPDDENSALLAYLSKDLHLRTAYLALNRGEGGQNLIGSEKGVALGIIRTSELMAARNVDGALQMFTRAYDFGYSKTVDETLSLWNRDEVLGDVVWAIRKFQPDIIVTRFPVTGEGKHGHHTASAVLAEEAFSAAGDPERFKEQLQFVQPWKATTLLLNNPPAKWDPTFTAKGKIAIDIGGLNTELGKSYGELAAESRNNHKSQGFGTAAEAGPRIEYFTFRAGAAPGAKPFEQALFALSNHDGTRALNSAIDDVIKDFRNHAPSFQLVHALLRLDALFRDYPEERWRSIKRDEIKRLILDLSGMKLEALSDTALIPPGEGLAINLRALRQRDSELALCDVSTTWSEHASPSTMKTGEWLEMQQKSAVPSTTAPSNQYWLTRPMVSAMFDVSDKTLIGEPFSPAAITADFTFCADGQKISYTCPVKQKTLDQRNGDRYEEVSVVPPVTVGFRLGAAFVPKDRSAKVEVTLTAVHPAATGTLEITAPPGWRVDPSSQPITFTDTDNTKQVALSVKPGASAETGILSAAFVDSDGTRSSLSRSTIDYPHIERRSYLQPAQILLSTAELNAPRLRLGYVMGAGDEIPETLRAIGYSPELLDEETLLRSDLARFDTIIVGIRALNTEKNWPTYYPRLMDFVKRGGTLVLQYSANDFLSKVPPVIGPYPFTLTSKRVTDEKAAVSLRLPRHALLQSPNRITGIDFENWIQERGLWFAGELDPHYEAPLEMADPGEAPERGALIAAAFGRGHFVYTGLAFFRQLPAGNPGAYRLFVNLLAYGHAGH